ncbi:CRISPR-associated endonuclease Cas1 [Candidatus Saccharibacteria bacterium]|nr:CRISPR-associated endonuclease Cas1 [Candidatus Saccharibacteria bacterium]MCL1963021.1 CRISPR-associated endonuclease Cas1 [Candidatus Saccharibacteria bacterium]
MKYKGLRQFGTQKHSLPPKTTARRVPLWLPYLQEIRKVKGDVFNFSYNGGEVESSLSEIQSIMIYGDSDTSLNVSTIDQIVRAGVPIIIHRRNITQPIYIFGGERPDLDDTISAQIRIRDKKRSSSHVARQLIATKMKSMSWLVDPLPLPMFASVDALRNIEAKHAKKYWHEFFTRLGYPEWTRRDKNPAAVALDAHSKFITGIILRWCTYHHLSPYHGFLHVTTDYPSLVYDLFEPYRGIFEQKLLEEWVRGGVNPKNYLGSAISIDKEFLDDKCYVPLTRQIVTHQELLHGIVLSLKYYCLGRQHRFLIPMPGKPNGGRPPKVEFLLYGRHAGKTDFWKVANEVSKRK